MKDIIDVSVRRSPRYSAFIIVGAALGMTAGLILSLLPVDTSALTTPVTQSSAVWMLMVVVGIIGGFLGAIVALVIDRRSVKRARTYAVNAEYEPARRRPARNSAPAPVAEPADGPVDSTAPEAPARGTVQDTGAGTSAVDPDPAAPKAPAERPGPDAGRGPEAPRTVGE